MNELKSTFNQHHPEKQPGEVFITNVKVDDFNLDSEFYKSWTNLRFGETAYDYQGYKQFDLKPVFGKVK
jgi:hypothetical protein